MQRTGQSPSLPDGKLPVFIFPTSLNFYSDDTSSYQDAVTLYNPYDFTLKYKVMCTAPKKYRVVEPEGTIKARCCVDIVIRHRDVSSRNENVKDKFRIQVSKYGEKMVIGRKDLPVMLLPTREKMPAAEETFESLLPSATATHHHGNLQASAGNRPFTSTENSRPSWMVIIATIFCVAALMLPTEADGSSSFASYICISNNQKLVAAFILGLITMSILRS